MQWLRIFPLAILALSIPLYAQDANVKKTEAPARVDAKPAEIDAKPTAAEVKPDIKFVRVSKEDEKHPLALQTAVVKYKSDSKETEGVEVTLIGAVHIAEKSYYHELNKLFTQYDAFAL